MKRLLDTHIFLWYISKDSRLPEPSQLMKAVSSTYPNFRHIIEILSIEYSSAKQCFAA